MIVSYSGQQEINNEKVVVINDPQLGPVKCMSNIIHKFRLITIEKTGSLVSFIRINPTTFISANTFVRNGIGRYLLKLNKEDDLLEHEPFNANLEMIPIVTNIPKEMEEFRYEYHT